MRKANLFLQLSLLSMNSLLLSSFFDEYLMGKQLDNILYHLNYFKAILWQKRTSIGKLQLKPPYAGRGFGPDGPYAKDPGYDVIASAIGGLLDITGPKCTDSRIREPVKPGVAVTDLITGLYAHGAILAALLHRNKTGEICQKVDMPELADIPEYKTNVDRVRNRDKLIEILSKKFLEHDLEHWKRVLRNPNFPSGLVNTIKEALEHEQTEHINIVKNVKHPQYGNVKIVGPLVRYSKSENRIRSAPPVLGGHTVEILSNELGLNSATLERLKREKAIDY